ncbi:hypothetical protein MNBD_GAMMA12-1751 [hydrothermal vent metagenome]|uniref:Uncharacterized protein n=1 Tax=hydrothermal vent metagenome TaxID=652676 RepID=A0A3B0YU04_9ZZZZ
MGVILEAIEEKFCQQVRDNSIDPEFLLVYSDWLQERGDPRGEIIALQYALQSTNNKEREVLQKRLKFLMHKQKIALDLTEKNLLEITLTWTAGAVTKLGVSRRGGVKSDILEALARSIFKTGQCRFLIAPDIYELQLKEIPQ